MAHPTTTTAEVVNDASPDSVVILICMVRGSCREAVSSHLRGITKSTNTTHYISRTLPAALGMPVATTEGDTADPQDSVSLFFYKSKDKRGGTSAKVFGSNSNVLHVGTAAKYGLKGAGGSP